MALAGEEDRGKALASLQSERLREAEHEKKSRFTIHG